MFLGLLPQFPSTVPCIIRNIHHLQSYITYIHTLLIFIHYLYSYICDICRIAHSSSDGGYDNGNDGDDDSDDDDDALLPSKLDVSCGKYDLLPDFDPNKHVFEKPFRIWYSMRIASHPSPPINALEVECACHCRAAIELLIENPTDRKIEYDVIVEGQDLITGEEVLSVHPKAAGIYQLDYAPAVVGKTRGRYARILQQSFAFSNFNAMFIIAFDLIIFLSND